MIIEFDTPPLAPQMPKSLRDAGSSLLAHLRNQSLPNDARVLIALYSLAVDESSVEISPELYQNWNHELVSDILPDYHSVWNELVVQNKHEVIALCEVDGVCWIDCAYIGSSEWTDMIRPAILNNPIAKACYHTMTAVWDMTDAGIWAYVI